MAEKQPEFTENNKQEESPFKDYPNARTLLVSAGRTRAFLERTARELLAGGTDALILSALGDAIGLSIQLALTLEEKRAAQIAKIVTERNSFVNRSYTPSLRILITKNPEFKGSRTPPAYIQFDCGQSITQAPAEGDATYRTATVVAGDKSFSFKAESIDPTIPEALQASGFEIEELEKLIKDCFESCLSKTQNSKGSVARAQVYENPANTNASVRGSMCRFGIGEMEEPLGAVVIIIFQGKAPFKLPSNSTLVYLVVPNRSDYPDAASYTEDVKKCSANLMTALCDFNGFAQREGTRLRWKRLALCRVPLFIHHENQPSETMEEVAKAIVQGMDEGYCHGPSPRTLYNDVGNVFRKVWTEHTGLDPVDISRTRRQ